MPEARDEAGNVWEVDAQGNPVRFLRGPSAGRILQDPTAQYEGPQAQANVEKTRTDAAVSAATAPATIRKAEADAVKSQVEAAETQQEMRLFENAQERKGIRQAFQTDGILRALRNARKIVQEDGGVGLESLFSGIPTTTAKKLETELAPIKGNLAFGNLQQMRDESKTGAAVGNVTERELDLLASTVASLDQGVDAQTFLDRLDAIERHFIGMQLNALGVDPNSEEGRRAFKTEYGYSGVFDGEVERQGGDLATGDSARRRTELPDAYQRQHLRYLRDNWGNLDPRAYTQFRAGLDEDFDQTPDLNAYASFAQQANQYAGQGGTPESMGSVPAPERELGMIESGINSAAQSAPGAFFANMGNAVGAGLPARMSGTQRALELLRDKEGGASFLGEMAGGALGTAALGGVGGAVRGGSMLTNPFASELLHGTIYGATQDDNILRGAGTGAVGSILGSVAGRKLGEALPDTFAPNAVRNADESVPSLDQLRRMENEAYARAQATGEVATPEATEDLYKTATELLTRNQKITPAGRMVNTESPVNDAMRLLQDYAGQPMTPNAANNVRNVLGEARLSPDRNQARIGRELVDTFDQWAEPSLPGIGDARKLAQRRIEGEQMARAGALGEQRGLRMKGNDVGDAMRTRFGQLDDQITSEQAFFTQPTTEAIQRAARGDSLTNAARAFGKYGLGNPLTAGGTGASSVAAYGGLVDPLYAAGALALGTAATGARKFANSRAVRAAKEAELTALGGREYEELLRLATEVAANNAGRIFGGGSAAAASNFNRQPIPIPQR